MSRTSSHLLLFTGLLLVSTAGPFLVAAKVDAYALALHRLAWSSLAFGAWAFATGAWRIAREHRARVALGAVLLAAHFALWIKAFDLTDYASNLLLLVAQPVIAALLGSRLGEHPTRQTWLSVVLAVAGLSIIARGDFALGPRALLGDALSLAGSLAITLFYVVTSRARAGTPLPAFMAATTGLGAVALLPVVVVAGVPLTGYTAESWAWIAALVLLTTIAGHGLMNFVARHVRLFTLNVVIVLEPAIGIALGIPLFGASATPLQVAGGAVLAAAVVIGLWTPVPAPVPSGARESTLGPG